MDPYDEDQIIVAAARAVGIHEITRMPIINVDERLLPKDYFRRAVDYRKIRHDLGQGVCIPGVEESRDYEYVLRRRREPQEAARLANDLAGTTGNLNRDADPTTARKDSPLRENTAG